MANSLTRMVPGRNYRRAVTIAGRTIVIRIAWWEAGTAGLEKGCWMMSAAPLRRRRTKLRWRPLADVLWDGFALDFTGGQTQLLETLR